MTRFACAAMFLGLVACGRADAATTATGDGTTMQIPPGPDGGLLDAGPMDALSAPRDGN